tara:strand:- start:153 stop:275 length:123 start_codon:yes stop_codon:yes gene_type:complete
MFLQKAFSVCQPHAYSPRVWREVKQLAQVVRAVVVLVFVC